MTKVLMVGLGYIGLPTASVVARAGMQVVGLDKSASVVETINRGEIHIQEDGLAALVKDMVDDNMLRAVTQAEAADVFIIAVPTPFADNHQPDTTFVEDAARSIAPFLANGNLIILESTCPVGTTKNISQILSLARPDLNFPGSQPAAEDKDSVSIAYCPERVLPGQILVELIQNDRVVGGLSSECSQKAVQFYTKFVEGECLVTDASSAEMIKLTENAFRDVNIAFANELSIISDKLGLNVWEIIKLANHHPRVNVLNPGPGVGGHCIAVDPWFIVHSAPDESPLIKTARMVNDGKVEHTIERAKSLIAKDAGPIGCLGLSFKPDIDDVRESPALKIVEALAEEFGERVSVCEPFLTALPQNLSNSGARLVDLEEILETCGTIILLVDHSVFKSVSPGSLAGKQVYDTRGVWPLS